MSREFQNTITSAIHTIYSAFKTVKADDDNPFHWYDGEFNYKHRIVISGRQQEDTDWNMNFVWAGESGSPKLVVDWYKYWPRGIEIDRELDSDELKLFLKDVAELVEKILTGEV